ncbi:MAG: hypothetical protein LBT92_02675 [Rickettsiales bacterium]|jgi:predicted F0F1-ATPase subunit|nr:hypothetical protein [Rickettsiales bacterium]
MAEKDLYEGLEEKIGRRAGRKAGRRRESGALAAVRLFGLVGWGVAAPLAVMSWIGWRLGERWTLSFILLGLAIGVYNTMGWISREARRK